MRIAVSGTHGSGKSTLVGDFLAAHPGYVHEPEPYEWLEDVYGEAAAEEPSVDDFYRQLELSVERLRSYEPGANVIAERSPLDFLAYVLALTDFRADGTRLFGDRCRGRARGCRDRTHRFTGAPAAE